jgi:hypothetical protein
MYAMTMELASHSGIPLRPTKCTFNALSSCMETHMTKVLLWVVGVILLIGLLVVFGVLDFIF